MDELLDLNARFLDYNNKDQFGGTANSFFPTNTTISTTGPTGKRAATVNKLEMNKISNVRDFKF